MIYSMPTSAYNIGEIITDQPLRLEWFPVNKSIIQKIRVYVTDGRNNIVDLNGQDFAISIFIEEEGKL